MFQGVKVQWLESLPPEFLQKMDATLWLLTGKLDKNFFVMYRCKIINSSKKALEQL